MKAILVEIQNKLIDYFLYVDENWGQLNMVNPPIKYPCVLIDCESAHYNNLLNNLDRIPKQRQEEILNIELTIATAKLDKTSSDSPKPKKDQAWEIYELMQKAHELLQGKLIGNAKLIRSAQKRISRIDGIQEHRVTYVLTILN